MATEPVKWNEAGPKERAAVLELLGVQKAVIAMWQKTEWANLPDLAIQILTKAQVQQ